MMSRPACLLRTVEPCTRPRCLTMVRPGMASRLLISTVFLPLFAIDRLVPARQGYLRVSRNRETFGNRTIRCPSHDFRHERLPERPVRTAPAADPPAAMAARAACRG